MLWGWNRVDLFKVRWQLSLCQSWNCCVMKLMGWQIMACNTYRLLTLKNPIYVALVAPRNHHDTLWSLWKSLLHLLYRPGSHYNTVCIDQVVMVTPCVSTRESLWQLMYHQGSHCDTLCIDQGVIDTSCVSPRESLWHLVYLPGSHFDTLCID